MVSFCPSNMGQFKFECCPQVQEISSVVYYLPALEVAFQCACLLGLPVLGGYFFAPPLFSGAHSVFHQPHLLSVCYESLLFVFSFPGQFGGGCCSLAQEMSSVICYLPCFRDWLIACLLLACLPFQFLFTDSLH
jgi:hypothetical protein